MPFQYIFECLALGGVLTFSIIFLSFFYLKSNKKYLYLSGYFFIHFIALILMSNAGSQYFSIDIFGVKGAEIPFLLLSLPLIILFFNQLLSIKKNRFIINIVISLIIISVVIYSFSPAKFNYLIAHLVNFQILLIFTAVYIYLVKLKHELVSYLLVIVVIYFLCFTANVFVSGWSEFNGSFLAVTDWLVGFIFLSFLYRQTLIIADEQSLAENEALELADNYQASYKELLIQQEEDQELLEARVQERTLELNIALQELEEANRELEQKNTLDELTGLFNRRYYD
ncbi:MAG: hypothetical protein KC484_08310, partial [Colwelliaceae bacterium]|nr:hypothetical protein [Colwelliaceae bacterium]